MESKTLIKRSLSRDNLTRVPCTFSVKRCSQTGVVYYMVQLYLIITEDFKVYSFLSPNDYNDNLIIISELGIDFHTHSIAVPVTPFQYKDLYYQISDYVSRSCSD